MFPLFTTPVRVYSFTSFHTDPPLPSVISPTCIRLLNTAPSANPFPSVNPFTPPCGAYVRTAKAGCPAAPGPQKKTFHISRNG